MNAPGLRPDTGCRLIDSVIFRMLAPVRAQGAIVHFVVRAWAHRPEPALCGERAPFTARGSQRWRLVKASGGRVCAACHAASCLEPSRIDW